MSPVPAKPFATVGPEPSAPDSSPDPLARLRRVQELFDAALERAAAERSGFLRAETEGDPTLLAEVMELLAVDDEANTSDLRDDQRPGLLPPSPGAGPDRAAAEPEPEQDLRQHLPRIENHPVLDSYVILRFVGRGGFGQVFRGRHLLTDRDVAIKLLTPGFMAGTEALDQLRREARIGATTLRHNNIVEVIDCSRRHGLHYLVMEWIRGENLAQRVQRLGARPIAEVLAIVRDLAAALAAAHENTVSHRDVNPNNVLVAHTGTAKLTDFGLARHRTDPALLRSNQAIGTPFFVAPEQRERLHDAEMPADVYGATATAFYLLTGTTPPAVDDDDHSQTIATELAEVAPPPLVALLCSGLAKSPADRPTDGGSLANDLDRVISELGIEPRIDSDTLAFPEPPLAFSDPELERMRERIGASRDLAEATPDGNAHNAGSSQESTTVGTRRRTWVLLAAAVLAVIAWQLVSGPGDATPKTGAGDPGGSKVSGKPTDSQSTANSANPDRGRQTDPSHGMQPNPNAPERPNSDKNAAPTEPVAEIQEILVADQRALEVRAGVLACALPGIAFGKTRPIDVEVVGSLPTTPALELLINGQARPAQERDAGRARFRLEPGPGSYRLEIRLGDSNRVVELEIPSIPAAVSGLTLTAADEKIGVHYQLTAMISEVDPLRFVHVRPGLLAGAAEVSREQFDAFAGTDAYRALLANDEPFRLWLQSLGKDLDWRTGFWRKKLRPSHTSVLNPELPVTFIHASEAVAFARWLSRELDGHRVVVPDYSTWRELANATFDRPANATGRMPFKSPRDAANYRPDGGDFRGSNGQESRARSKIEGVWARPQGSLLLRHVGGNAAELIVERYTTTPNESAPSAVAFLGGAYDDEQYALTIPSRAELRLRPTIRAGRRFHEPQASGGFRLAIITDP